MSLFSVGDTAPDFTATLSSAGAPANLTGATPIEVHFVKPSGTVLVRVPSIVAPLAGTIAYTWVTGDLSEAGAWQWKVKVTFAGGRIQTFPGASNFLVDSAAA